MGAGLLAVGGLLRVAYLLDYAALPFAEGPLGDSAVYLHQAARIAAGDHGDTSLLAMSPGYGYVLALFGGAAWPVIGAQAALGLLAGLLVARLARATAGPEHGDAAALGALLLYLGYGLVPFYESKLLSDSLGLSLALGAAALLATTGARAGRPAQTVAAGVVVGLAVLVRAHLVFVAPLLPLAALAPWSSGEPWRLRLRRAAWLGGGLGAVLLARGLFTLHVAGVFVPVLYTAPEAHVVRASSGAAAGARFGSLGFQTEGPPSAWDVVRRVDAHRRGSARGAAERGGGPGSSDDSRGGGPDLLGTARSIDLRGLLRTAPDKLAATFRPVETTHQYAYYGERARIVALQVHAFSFTLIAWLALAGAVALLAGNRGHALWAHAPWIVGIVAVCLLYLPSARYRLPMLVGLLPLAGAGVAALVRAAGTGARAWRDPRWQASALAALVAAWLCWDGARTHIGYAPRNPERWELVVAESLLLQPHDPAEVEARLARARAISAARRGGQPDPAVDAHVEALRARLRPAR